MSDARAAILTRIRQAQRTGRIPVASDPVRVPTFVARTPEDNLRRFVTELTALGVEPHVEASAADVRARVTALVEGHPVFSWDPEWLPYDVGSVLVDAVHGDSSRATQAAAGIGVTGDAALADRIARAADGPRPSARRRCCRRFISPSFASPISVRRRGVFPRPRRCRRRVLHVHRSSRTADIGLTGARRPRAQPRHRRRRSQRGFRIGRCRTTHESTPATNFQPASDRTIW